VFFRFVTKHACDKQTDGQTNRITTTKTALSQLLCSLKTGHFTSREYLSGDAARGIISKHGKIPPVNTGLIGRVDLSDCVVLYAVGLGLHINWLLQLACTTNNVIVLYAGIVTRKSLVSACENSGQFRFLDRHVNYLE